MKNLTRSVIYIAFVLLLRMILDVSGYPPLIAYSITTILIIAGLYFGIINFHEFSYHGTLEPEDESFEDEEETLESAEESFENEE